MKFSLYYIFNLTVMLTVVGLFNTLEDPRRYFANAFATALVISAVGIGVSALFPGFFSLDNVRASGRLTGFFNNPNQLGYFSLCMMAALLVLAKGQVPRQITTITALACGVLGILTSASLAAISGMLALAASVVVANWTHMSKILRSVCGALLVCMVVIAFDFYFGGWISDRLYQRFGAVDHKIEQLETERAYHRIHENTEYLLFGAGEGSVERFSVDETREIHSSFGTMLFSYGVIGLCLFLVLLWRALSHAPIYVWLCAAGPLTYSVAHMGLRATYFWIFITVILLEHRQTAPPRIRKRNARISAHTARHLPAHNSF